MIAGPLPFQITKRYLSLVGGLSYFAICTKPGIIFSFSILDRHLHAFTKNLIVWAEWVDKYISGTTNKTICYPNRNVCSSPLVHFAEADWKGCKRYWTLNLWNFSHSEQRSRALDLQAIIHNQCQLCRGRICSIFCLCKKKWSGFEEFFRNLRDTNPFSKTRNIFY